MDDAGLEPAREKERQKVVKRGLGVIWVALYVATILGANWAISTFGVIPVGFGLIAPAGVLFAGLGFTLRDLTQDALGRWATLMAIGAGALLSMVVSPAQIALASGLSFLVSETADLMVYTPIRQRQWLLAVALSNTAGLVIDSGLFLWLAFGGLDLLTGQIIGKLWMTGFAVAVLYVWRLRRSPISAAA